MYGTVIISFLVGLGTAPTAQGRRGRTPYDVATRGSTAADSGTAPPLSDQ
ncbi:MAG: hypothetical protein VYE68_05980 [Acidobacteriota bacterium]|nr:hypothetical protein [Acidobacteriota bacterium]